MSIRTQLLMITSALILGACSPESATEVVEAAPSDTPASTATAAPTQRPTDTPTPEATPTPVPLFAEWVTPIVEFVGDDVEWIPGRNSLLVSDCDSKTGEFAWSILQGPDFEAVELENPSGRCIFPEEYSISPDGETIVFVGPLPEGHERADDRLFADIWMMDGDGSNPRRFYPEGSASRMLSILGWMDAGRFITYDYLGGGNGVTRVHDLAQRKIERAEIYYGSQYRANADFIPVGIDWPSLKVYVIINPQQAQSAPFLGVEGLAEMPSSSRYPEGEYNFAFHSWRPHSNQMLVLVTTVSEPFEVDLLLWDVDTGKVSILEEGVANGGFSPDGNYLVVTRRDAEANFGVDVYAWEDRRLVLSQLVDVSNNLDRGFSRLPFEPDVEPYLNFSRDGHLLAFRDGAENVMKVFDLAREEVVLEIAEAYLPNWSPDSTRMIVRLPEGKSQIIDLQEGTVENLNLRESEKIISFRWSYDGAYLLVGFFDNSPYDGVYWVVAAP
ncbi:MAG: hypothetical protein OEV06_12685 [Anaerolineae bacterium]|nr:hypothetical protein [Anaerolineae bacterium]